MIRRKKYLVAMVISASIFILGGVLMYLNAYGIISMGATYPPLIPFLAGWAGCILIYLYQIVRSKQMLCGICGKFIGGDSITCRIDEGKHKGMFFYFHKKCAEENLVKVNIEEK